MSASASASPTPPHCPSCGGSLEYSATRHASVCTHCGTALTEEADDLASSPSSQTTTSLASPSLSLPPSLPPSFAQSPLGKLADRFSAQQQNPDSFVRGLRDLSADAEKSGLFSTLGSIASVVRWLAMLFFAGLAVLCVIGAVKGRQAGILLVPAGVSALIAWFLFSLGSKSSH